MLAKVLLPLLLAFACAEAEPNDPPLAVPSNIAWVASLQPRTFAQPITETNFDHATGLKHPPLLPADLAQNRLYLGYTKDQIDALDPPADIILNEEPLMPADEWSTLLPEPTWAATIENGAWSPYPQSTLPALTAAWMPQKYTWEERTTAIAPAERRAHGMAYDSKQEIVVLFGGWRDHVSFGDTWEYLAGSWVSRIQTRAPSARDSFGMADTGDGVLLFGGINGSDPLGDTWIYRDHAWTEIVTATAPSPRRRLAMAYDERRQRVVLFGGRTETGWEGDTWEFDGTDWMRSTPIESPPPRTNHQMVYDHSRNQILLFGGKYLEDLLNDTWLFDGTTWTELITTTAPKPRRDATLYYDIEHAQAVLYGGLDNTSYGDLWVLEEQWLQVAQVAVPGFRAYHAMAYDRVRDRGILFGGKSDGLYPWDTWELIFR